MHYNADDSYSTKSNKIMGIAFLTDSKIKITRGFTIIFSIKSFFLQSESYLTSQLFSVNLFSNFSFGKLFELTLFHQFFLSKIIFFSNLKFSSLILKNVNLIHDLTNGISPMSHFFLLSNNKADNKIITVTKYNDMSVNHINDVSELQAHFILKLKNFYEDCKN